MTLKHSDTTFFIKYHNEKSTELWEAISGILRVSARPKTQLEIIALLPDGPSAYIEEQSKVLEVLLQRKEHEGELETVLRNGIKAYKLRS